MFKTIPRRSHAAQAEKTMDEAAYRAVTRRTAKLIIEPGQVYTPPGFGEALSLLRRFAHSQGFVVMHPTKLRGVEQTGFGDSDNFVEGEATHNLGDPAAPFGNIYLPKEYRDDLIAAAPILLRAEVPDVSLDYTSDPCPSMDAPPEDGEKKRRKWQPESGRWYLRAAHDRGNVACVIRTGEGKDKHYHLWLVFGGKWFKSTGLPPFDLPLFGLKELLADEKNKPVMIHEGPKAWVGAIKAAINKKHPLHKLMASHLHVAWQGAEAGIGYTDWSPLKGRKVVCWPDMDANGAGAAYMGKVAREISQMGDPVAYYVWPTDWCRAHDTWDMADDAFPELTPAAVRGCLRSTEWPFNARGKVLLSFASRTAIDPHGRTILMATRRYRPMSYEAVNTKYGKDAFGRIQKAIVEAREVVGPAFLPGYRYGDIVGDFVNCCPPSPRDSVPAAPLPRALAALVLRALRGMAPNFRERKHLIRRLAWAVACPARVPLHAIVLQGNSGVGKSLLMDLLCEVVGLDRAETVFPDSVFSDFNGELANKQVLGVHEIHSDDITRKQNASRLKEMIGNSRLSYTKKYADRVTVPATIHWFMATNEMKPFSLAGGNDRFYFVRATFPGEDGGDVENAKAEWQTFLTAARSILLQPPSLDALHAAARHLIGQWKPEKFPHHAQRIAAMEGRAKRQDHWLLLESASLEPWKQNALRYLDNLYGGKLSPDKCFFADRLFNLIHKDMGRGAGYTDLTAFLNQQGYRSVTRRSVSEGRLWVWMRKEHVPKKADRGKLTPSDFVSKPE